MLLDVLTQDQTPHNYARHLNQENVVSSGASSVAVRRVQQNVHLHVETLPQTASIYEAHVKWDVYTAPNLQKRPRAELRMPQKALNCTRHLIRVNAGQKKSKWRTSKSTPGGNLVRKSSVEQAAKTHI